NDRLAGSDVHAARHPGVEPRGSRERRVPSDSQRAEYLADAWQPRRHAEGSDSRQGRGRAGAPRMRLRHARHMTNNRFDDRCPLSSASSVVESFLPAVGLAIMIGSEALTLAHVEPFWSWN